uniref:LIF receptor subunit alpha n=1 Tax=Leptobrachium leishanense TaxID=445787 RepID=A0A8C5LL27_9ANUR
MWDKLHHCFFLAAIFSCFPWSIHSQDSLDFFQNLTCLTHDIDYLLCSWETPLPPSSDIIYDICYRSSESLRCFKTNESRLMVEFKIFTTYDFTIRTETDRGPAEIRFQKSSEEIQFVPHTPEILSFDADYKSDDLNVTWRWNTSSCLDGVAVKWAVEILRSENLIAVKTGEFTTECDQQKTEFQWSWTSEMSLECTSHSVRIRCYVNEEHYGGAVMWSEWSELHTVYGSSQENAYPQDKVVAVGSSVTFCCTVKGEHYSIQFQSTTFPAIQISKNTSYIELKNLNVSGDSGDNLICNTSNNDEPIGSVIFVGYPPDKPQNFSCETHDLKDIECKWGLGRETGLMGERSTTYTLYESNTGKTIECKEDTCTVKVIEGQTLYEFVLRALNVLGQSAASLAINVMERVHLYAPSLLKVSEISPNRASVSWEMIGRLAPLQILCEIEKHTVNGGTKMFNVTFFGISDGSCTHIVRNLRPYHVYDFRVHCATADHFWKWSNWSLTVRHHTSQAAPSRKPEIWREITGTSENRTITIYWKPLSTAEANGPVISYEVSWKPLQSNTKPKRESLSASHNNTQIILNGYEGDYEITVQANNSAGLSPASKITTVQLPNEYVEFEQQVGTGDGINITWTYDSNVSCGHVIQWRPLSSSLPSHTHWNKLLSPSNSAFIPSALFPHGVRCNVSVFGCEANKYKLLKVVTGYTQELSPKAAPNFTVVGTTSESVQIKWDAIPDEDLQGFLQGYVLYIVKKEQDAPIASARDLILHADKEIIKNVTNPALDNLTAGELQSGTSYYLGLVAYTRSGEGPMKLVNVVTNENAMGLILAILIPILVAVLLGVLISTICYRKREWIKETFYPEIPNPENSKALQFQKNLNEGNKNVKVLEMNPCTPNNVEVVQTVPKVLDTEINSPSTEDLIKLPEDGLDTDENHVVISYCPPAVSEDAVLDQSGVSSQVVYIDVQSMYQPQGNAEEQPDDDLDGAGYKPQMHLAINAVKDSQAPAEDNIAEEVSGYRPQENPETWAGESPGSPSSLESNMDNASFGSPCSVNSRHFLIPPVDDKDSLKPTHVGWSISSLFQNKQDD